MTSPTEPPMSDDIVTWLRACIAEDETDAGLDNCFCGWCDTDPRDFGWKPPNARCGKRILAACAAHRAIIDAHAPDQPYCGLNFSNANHDYFEGPCDTLRALASIYSDRPGWRKEWTL